MGKWKHDQLLFDLANHLAKPERMMWTDMPMEEAGSCRPDILTINKSFTRPSPLIYEIKTSVSDFRSDITSGKWQRYMKYACAVIFATPKGMVTKNDIPNGCGLILRSEKGWRMSKAPTLQNMPDMPINFWLKMLMSGISQEDANRREVNKNEYLNSYSVKKQFNEDVQKCLSDLESARHEVIQIRLKNDRDREFLSDRVESAFERATRSINAKKESIENAEKLISLNLGIDINNSWDFRRKIKKLIDRCDSDKEVSRLRGVILSMQKALQEHLDGGINLI